MLGQKTTVLLPDSSQIVGTECVNRPRLYAALLGMKYRKAMSSVFNRRYVCLHRDPDHVFNRSNRRIADERPWPDSEMAFQNFPQDSPR